MEITAQAHFDIQDPEITDTYAKLSEEEKEQVIQAIITKRSEAYYKSHLKDNAGFKEHEIKLGTGLLRLIANRFPDIEDGLKATISSCIILAWTSIEVLSGDLWEASVNTFPQRLAKLVGSRNRLSKLSGDDVQSDRAKGSAVTLSLQKILEETSGSFEVKELVGTILRRQEECTFISLPAIRESYSRAFDKSSAAIDAALGDKSLDALSQVRHLLVHSGGKADDRYIAKLSYLPMPKADKGREIGIDGEVACNLIKPAIQCGRALIEAVDDWISSNR